ncbi:LD-carboxypeptidase [Streptomyces sp. GMR22]|uniref:LD-carboxypeptidase n=1 Tax=Streptomyces sp. GMR22 TaxID=2759524 RepID=UPI0015FC0457|nr:LD-carboxypeptidase [Streptomyces sp. GMR22]MBA6439093.1 LD-carboxypeptidase [Streptomyces sp. GMR22]
MSATPIDQPLAHAPLRVPPPVGPGAHIRVISPTGPSVVDLADRARRGEGALASAGFTVSYGKYARDISADGTRAGDPRKRAADFMEAFEDPSVDAVMAADAGAYSRELLDFLDPGPIAANPKPFIGFCDNVFLHQFLATHAGLSSLYGCILVPHLGEAGGAFPETLECLIRALDSTRPLVCEPVPTRTGEWINWYLPQADSRRRHRGVRGGWSWLAEGTCTGRLLGGEISVVPELVERFDLSLTSSVFFWHKAFKGAEAETAFRNLCESTDLTGLAGMVVGAHPEIPPPEWAARVSDLLDELLPDIHYPVVVNSDISHLSPPLTVPYGEEVTLDPTGRMVFERGTNQH